MTVLVIDTNCLIQIIPSISKYHWIWNYFFEGRYRLAITTDILNEYFASPSTKGQTVTG